uniref:Uncharacterized protein n=1 Tax=Neogobius melanostomus TaxID=47308 RepID=A0A8C6WWJ5_9GOBI
MCGARPKAVDSLLMGFSAASFSLRASKRGCFMMRSFVENMWKSRASHILRALGTGLGLDSCSGSVSGNCGSSESTTMCFFRRIHPLTLDPRPLDLILRTRSVAAEIWFGSGIFLVDFVLILVSRLSHSALAFSSKSISFSVFFPLRFGTIPSVEAWTLVWSRTGSGFGSELVMVWFSADTEFCTSSDSIVCSDSSVGSSAEDAGDVINFQENWGVPVWVWT